MCKMCIPRNKNKQLMSKLDVRSNGFHANSNLTVISLNRVFHRVERYGHLRLFPLLMILDIIPTVTYNVLDGNFNVFAQI